MEMRKNELGLKSKSINLENFYKRKNRRRGQFVTEGVSVLGTE